MSKAHWPISTQATRARLLAVAVCVSLPLVAHADSTGTVSLSQYQAQLAAAQQMIAACRSAAASCGASGLPTDERVTRPGNAAPFRAEWQWLRDAVTAAKKEPQAKRVSAMRAAGDHLAELAQEASGAPPPGPAVGFQQARTAANTVLNSAEFQAAAGPTWLDRQVARLEDWFFRLLMGMDRLGSRNPWLAPVIEWTCFLLAAGGLVFFVRRSLARQALRIALGESAAVRRTDRDTTEWAQLAEERATAGDWRDAVHCLYWAAIVSLETRRVWKANPTRTPREYVRLLRPGSEAQQALRELTRIFERVWYGQAEATERDFRSAEESFAAIFATLKAADLKRETPAPAAASAGVA